jgi:hypothetical protein
VPPAELVELIETEPRHDAPEPAGDSREWVLRLGAGG